MRGAGQAEGRNKQEYIQIFGPENDKVLIFLVETGR
jgi:hypothetical protein